ncbi:hypothetical protein SE91_12225 [Bradyrhizobium sp. DOA1]|nr:hypothetical protein SE91_12225 [Bradyrhizobium sp. DOA1]
MGLPLLLPLPPPPPPPPPRPPPAPPRSPPPDESDMQLLNWRSQFRLMQAPICSPELFRTQRSLQ